ncbi:DUF2642 domain-containing protein [Ureibacillus chungkukjangi]|uniref:Uncharacterized protein DUF2642 n=1 Tax=Ureibacillus chungkukjangi TaxID=1202712 RepID=A0A318TXB6_9BACL|nr:DUF2642 domain-containing protein [Ureibacillus chungkukjangi]PYF08397.1 uncharacterized protein DUF2642 [Ureibacillus chungkukjangi]
MHSPRNQNHNLAVPPGQYKYSNHFPQVMQQLSPTYTVATEPVFFDHLLMNVGKSIRVVTLNDTLEGTLSGVAIDHIQLTIGEEHYHIRIQHISYFVGKP